MKANVVGDLLKDNIIIPSQAISGTTPIVSDVASISNLDGICFQLVTTSTVAGTWKVEVSNDWVSSMRPSLNQAVSSGTWTDITSAFSPAITNPAGSATNQYVQAYPLVAAAVRVTFTPSAGAGNCYVTYFGKGNR